MKKIVLLILMMAVMSQAFLTRASDRGEKLFKEGKYEEALQEFTAARTEDPDSKRIAYNIGTCLYKLGRHEEAKGELTKAMHDRDSVLARNVNYNLSAVEYRLGEGAKEPKERIANWREAIALLKRSLDVDPSHEPSKKNVEFIQRKLKEELDKLKDQQNKDQDKKDEPPPEQLKKWKEILAQALQLAKKRMYEEAKSLLDGTIQSEPESEQTLGQASQRIQDVMDMDAGREPSRPIQTGDAADDMGVI